MTRNIIPLMMFVAFAVSCSGDGAINAEPAKMTYSIDNNWTFRQVDTAAADWLPATVPGCVHTDLLDNGIIEDPFYSTNEQSVQWIETKDWEYRTTFNPGDKFRAAAVQEIVFDGLDTYAEVYLNDQKILAADNMFLQWRADIKGKLRPGDNTLHIIFRSAYNVGLELAKKLPITLPADNDRSDSLKTSLFTRKAQYHYGWDWGPRMVTCGIWRPVTIQAYDQASIRNVQYVQKSQKEDKADFDANFTVNATDDRKVTLMVVDTAGTIYVKERVALKKGAENRFKLSFRITNPKLWWPNGAGEPNLYALNAIIVDADTKLDESRQNIGVRTLKLIREKDDVGESFCFEVNGEIIFAKGANYIPQDVFLSRVTPDRYEKLISDAKQSGMNMLRVWGGGIYENDLFYDLCDRNGIMVWQDFMFACGFYPWDAAFLANVQKEVQYNVERLRNHPCLAIWCGNNEIDEAWNHWGYQKVYNWTEAQQKQISHGIDTLFRSVIPAVLAKEDPTRYYHSSSPLYGRGNPKSQTMGDFHYWGVFHDEEPFSMYKDKPGRFSNEYGFESLACYDTYREYLKPEELKLYSPAMVVHQKSPKGYRVIEEYMARDLPLLKDNFRTYVYLTQLLQAEGIKIAMEGHRQKRPFTQGSLYWQLNDVWPVASWSSIDYKGRWKALQFYARRSFAPTILSFERIDSTRRVKLWAINDMLRETQFEGSLKLIDFEGNMLWRRDYNVPIPSNGNVAIMLATDEELLQKADPTKVMLVMEGTIDGKPARAIHYFLPFKDLKLPRPDYEVHYAQEGTTVRATIKANKLLKNLLFEASSIQNNPSDAYFDMLPGDQREITLQFKDDLPVSELGIFVTCLNDLVGKPSLKPITQNVK